MSDPIDEVCYRLRRVRRVSYEQCYSCGKTMTMTAASEHYICNQADLAAAIGRAGYELTLKPLNRATTPGETMQDIKVGDRFRYREGNHYPHVTVLEIGREGVMWCEFILSDGTRYREAIRPSTFEHHYEPITQTLTPIIPRPTVLHERDGGERGVILESSLVSHIDATGRSIVLRPRAEPDLRNGEIAIAAAPDLCIAFERAVDAGRQVGVWIEREAT